MQSLNRRNDRASLSLELAFVLPVMVIMVVGSLFLGISYINKSALVDASAVGARSAAYYGADNDQVRSDIYDALNTRFLAGRENVEVKIQFYPSSGLPTATYTSAGAQGDGWQKTSIPGTPAPTIPGTQIANPGDKIVVQLRYPNYNLNIPFVSNSTFTMTGTSVSRNTNP